jgi:hypothetical protein
LVKLKKEKIIKIATYKNLNDLNPSSIISTLIIVAFYREGSEVHTTST